MTLEALPEDLRDALKEVNALLHQQNLYRESSARLKSGEPELQQLDALLAAIDHARLAARNEAVALKRQADTLGAAASGAEGAAGEEFTRARVSLTGAEASYDLELPAPVLADFADRAVGRAAALRQRVEDAEAVLLAPQAAAAAAAAQGGLADTLKQVLVAQAAAVVRVAGGSVTEVRGCVWVCGCACIFAVVIVGGGGGGGYSAAHTGPLLPQLHEGAAELRRHFLARLNAGRDAPPPPPAAGAVGGGGLLSQQQAGGGYTASVAPLLQSYAQQAAAVASRSGGAAAAVAAAYDDPFREADEAEARSRARAAALRAVVVAPPQPQQQQAQQQAQAPGATQAAPGGWVLGGAPPAAAPAPATGLWGTPAPATNPFGGLSALVAPAPAPFGVGVAPAPAQSAFGLGGGGGLFGSAPAPAPAAGLFGSAPAPAPAAGLFGNAFGAAPAQPTAFGAGFGAVQAPAPAPAAGSHDRRGRNKKNKN